MRRGILLLAAALFNYAIVILISGGFVIDTPFGALTSRAAIRPFIAAGLLLLFYRVHLRQHWRSDIAPLDRITWPPVIAAAASVTTVVVGVAYGTTIAGGPDASGYVSQAAMLARGELTLPSPAWLAGASWHSAAYSAAAVGYAPSPDATRLVPTYPPGLPLFMAAFQVVFGPRAVFYVVPLLGGVAVWATWLIGNGFGNPWAGACAAILLFASPIFLLMLVQPMSDVPATAFWALSLAAALYGRTGWSGMAASVAILIRPNTVPLAVVPLLALVAVDQRNRIRRVLVFGAAIAPAAAVIGLLLRHYYGSPFNSGYGTLEQLFGFDRVGYNAAQYARWFLSSETVFPLLGLLAPAIQRHTPARILTGIVVIGFPSAVLILYLLYEFVMPAEVWMYLRFLLPAFPPLLVGFAMVMLAISRRFHDWFSIRVACAVVIWWVAVHGWQYARERSVFGFKGEDARYARTAEYARALPENSVLVSLAHAGPLRFYGGRDVLRFDALDGTGMDSAIAYFESRGQRVFLVGDPNEVDMFRERFPGTTAVARLEAAPRVDLGGAVIYHLSQ